MNKQAKGGFSKWGWWIIIYSGLLYYMMTGSSADGLNIYVTGFTEKYGWNYTTLLSFSTWAGIVGMVISFLMARVLKKRGARFVIVVSAFIAGAGLIGYGFSRSIVMYFVMLCVFCSFATVFSFQATGSLVANWFPKKRGMAMGYITAFMPLASATYLYLLNGLIGKLGLNMGIAVTGIMTLVLGVVGIFCIKDHPEEVGEAPDNEPLLQEAEKAESALKAYQSPWTPKVLFRNKTMWCVAVGYGLLMMCNTGVISQLVPRITVDKGLDTSVALLMFSTAAVVGIFFSVFWGWLDRTINTKRASFVMIIFFAVSVIMNLIPNNMLTLWISIIMIGGDLGGTANFLVSMTTGLWGRRDFDAAYSIIYPIFSVIRTFAFAVVAFGVAVFGGKFLGQQYAGAYIILLFALLASFICVAMIDYTKFLGHDEELEEKKRTTKFGKDTLCYYQS